MHKQSPMNVNELREILADLPADAGIEVSYEGDARLDVQQVVIVDGVVLLDANGSFGSYRRDAPDYIPDPTQSTT